MSRAYRNKKGGSGGAGGNAGGSRVVVMIVVLVLLVAVGAGIIYLMNRDGSNDNPGVSGAPATTSPIMKDNETFYDGVFVDDIPLGGLKREEAKQQIEAKQAERAATAAVTITKDAESWQIMASEATYTFDTDAVLEEAYKQGRVGTSQERQEAVEKLPSNPVKLYTKITVDPTALEQKVRDLAAPFTVAPVNAAFKEYDSKKPKGERLVFTPEVPGSRVDADALWAAVQKEFTEGTLGTVAMQVVPVEAAVTVASLQSELTLIGTYDTNLLNSKPDRRNNITLANKTINGKMLMPGETFSMNDTTGQRTEAKGYKDAPIDKNGVEDIGIAGGVCQVSGTLYNAAIYAGPNLIEIVTRRNHSIPSTYMGDGKDATVDFDSGKDFRFKNLTDKPMLIIIYLDYDKSRSRYKYQEHAEIYGKPDPEGAHYKLVAKRVRVIEKKTSDKPIYIASKAVGPGHTKEIGGRNGRVVDVFLYKVDKDGKETKIKKLYTDTYPATSDVIAYYYKDAKPTPTPTPTATPEPTPKPSSPATPPPSEPTPTPDPTPTPVETTPAG